MTGYDTISFLSDFGHDDEFVGVVHSVIRSISPATRVIDVTHGIAPHDTRAGGLALARSAPYLARGVVIAVVDPGVGTDRRPVAVEVGGGSSILVGPDNGLLAPAVGLVGGATAAVELTNPEYLLVRSGSTFDGRDVFAPAAAHLCNGVPMTDLGRVIDPAGLLPGVLPVCHQDGDDLVGEVLWIDRFGNCQLNIGPDDIGHLGTVVQLVIGDQVRTAEQVTGYDDIPAGRLGLMVDSSGLVAIAVARASAAAELGVAEGTQVRLRPPGLGDPITGTGGVVSAVELTPRQDRA
jgi:S-adenosylmethionine hydrolase